MNDLLSDWWEDLLLLAVAGIVVGVLWWRL